jgi:hypothetical protein
MAFLSWSERVLLATGFLRAVAFFAGAFLALLAVDAVRAVLLE